MPPSHPSSPHRPPPPTKVKSLKLQFRNPNSQPASPAATPPPQQQPVASSSSRPAAAKDKDKAALALAKRKKKQQALDRQAKRAAGRSARHSPQAPTATLLTAGTSSRPQVHQIVRKPAATVFAAEPTAGFDDDGNSTLSELSSAEEDEDDQPVAGPSSAGAGVGVSHMGEDDEMEEEPRWDEEYNGAWERRRGSFPSDDDDRRARGSAGDDRGSSVSASDDDMDDDDSDMNGLSGSEHSDGIRVLSFDATGARVHLGVDGAGHANGGWSDDSSEADDEEEELWFEDYEQFGTMEMDVDGSGGGAGSGSPVIDGSSAGGPSTLTATSSALIPGGPTADDPSATATALGSGEPSTQPSPTEHELDTQAFDALQFLADDADVAAGQVYEDLHQSHHDGLHMLEDFDGQLIFSALADALGNLGGGGGSGPEKGSNGVFQWATESEGDSDGSKDAARMDDLWDESDTDDDHYFGDEEGDTTDSLPEDEVDEAIKRSLLEEEPAPTPPSLALSASLVRQLASTGSETYSTPSLVSPALSAAQPVPLVQSNPSIISALPMEIGSDPSPPPPPPPPIARSPSIVSEAATVSSAGDASRPRPAPPTLAALRKTPSAPPAMGCFIPAPSPARFKSVIIDGAGDREGGAPPPTPFTRRKSAEKNGARSRGQSLSLKTGSTGRKRDRHNKVKHPFVAKTKRTRYGSMTPSRMSPRPPLREDTPSSPDVEPVSLEDVLDTSLFHHGLPSSTSDPSLHATSANGATDRERFLADHSVRNLRRWDRVSIGTFRGRLGGGGGGIPSRGAFASQATRPTHHAHHNHHAGVGVGGRPASQGYDHSPSKGSIFRSEQELEPSRNAAERTLVMSPVIAPSGAPPAKGKQRELEGFVL